MATMTLAEKRERRLTRAAANMERELRMAEQRAETLKALETNKCPQCGAGVHSNLALSGWVQCDHYGSPGFQKVAGPACSWQGFWK